LGAASISRRLKYAATAVGAAVEGLMRSPARGIRQAAAIMSWLE
jgi:hypothetical protein